MLLLTVTTTTTTTAADYYVPIIHVYVYDIIVYTRVYFLLGTYDVYSVHVLLAVGLHDEPVEITFVSVPKTMDFASEPRRRPAAYYIRVLRCYVFVCVGRRPGAFKYLPIYNIIGYTHTLFAFTEES